MLEIWVLDYCILELMVNFVLIKIINGNNPIKRTTIPSFHYSITKLTAPASRKYPLIASNSYNLAIFN